MGTFSLSNLNPSSRVSMVNTISTLLQKSLDSYDPRIVSISIAFSLPISQDPIPLPSSSLSEHIMTSSHKIRRTKRKGGRHWKQKPNKKAPASGHNVGHHPPLASTNHVGGKVPTSSHHDGKKLDNGYHAKA